MAQERDPRHVTQSHINPSTIHCFSLFCIFFNFSIFFMFSNFCFFFQHTHTLKPQTSLVFGRGVTTPSLQTGVGGSMSHCFCVVVFHTCQKASRNVVSAATIILNVRGGAPQFQIWTDASSCSFGQVICPHRCLPDEYGTDFQEVEGDPAWQAEWEFLGNLTSLRGFFFQTFGMQSADC